MDAPQWIKDLKPGDKVRVTHCEPTRVTGAFTLIGKVVSVKTPFDERLVAVYNEDKTDWHYFVPEDLAPYPGPRVTVRTEQRIAEVTLTLSYDEAKELSSHVSTNHLTPVLQELRDKLAEFR